MVDPGQAALLRSPPASCARMPTVVKRAAASDEPVFITQHGRASAVLVSTAANRLTQDELEVLRQLARGEADIEAGVGYDPDSVMAEADALLGEA